MVLSLVLLSAATSSGARKKAVNYMHLLSVHTNMLGPWYYGWVSLNIYTCFWRTWGNLHVIGGARRPVILKNTCRTRCKLLHLNTCSLDIGILHPNPDHDVLGTQILGLCSEA